MPALTTYHGKWPCITGPPFFCLRLGANAQLCFAPHHTIPIVAHKNQKKNKNALFRCACPKEKCNQDTPTKKIDSHTVRHKMLQLKKKKEHAKHNQHATSHRPLEWIPPGKQKRCELPPKFLALTRQTPAFMIWCFFVWILFAVPYLAAARFACKKKMFSNPHCYAYGKADHHPLRTANRLWKHPWSVPSQQARDLLPAAGCSIRGGIPDTFLGTLPANEQKIKIRKNVCSQELREIRTPRNLRPHFVTIKKHFWQWNSGSLESACDVTKIL